MLQLQVTIQAEAPRCGDVPLFRYVLQYTVLRSTKSSAHTYDVRPDGHRHHVTWTRGVSVKPYSLLSFLLSICGMLLAGLVQLSLVQEVLISAVSCCYMFM